MKIHEYQGKEVLKRYGVPVPLSIPVLDADNAGAEAGKAWDKIR